MSYERYFIPTVKRGENTARRMELLKTKTGKCEVCGINLYSDKRPCGTTMPCPIGRCPYG
tara:strand:+ start:1441 stop:1620 length:180 start_codon:yes stop_codon:yes gene_type:complete